MPQHIATWNPQTQLWVTEQADLFSGQQEPFSETFPTSGMTRSGRLLPLPVWAPLTGEKECSSLLPTPRSQNGEERNSNCWVRPLDEPQNIENAFSQTAECHGNASDAPRDGRDEGRPESARLVGGFDAAVSGDGHVDLLPTPCVVDRLATTDMTLEQWDESRRSQKERGVGSFGPRGDSLGAAVLRVEEGSERPDYSTTGARQHSPSAADAPRDGWDEGRPESARLVGGFDAALGGDEPGVALLPTPQARDFKGTDSASDHNRHSPGMDAVTHHFPALLPTPSLSDNKTPRRGDQLADTVESNTHTLNLADAVEHTHGRDAEVRQWGKYAPAIARWEAIAGLAPAPTEPNKNGNPRLSAAFSEWLMGWPAGWVTDPAIGISRNDQLRIIGNGVCPHQAHSAIRQLTAIVRLAIPTNRGAPNNPEITRL